MVIALASAFGLLLTVALSTTDALAQAGPRGPVLLGPVESSPLPPPAGAPAEPDSDDEDDPADDQARALPPANEPQPGLFPWRFPRPFDQGRAGNSPYEPLARGAGPTGAVAPNDPARPDYGGADQQQPGFFGRQLPAPGLPSGQPVRPAEIQPGDPVGPRDVFIDPLRPAARSPMEISPGEPRPPMDLSPEQRRSAIAALPPEDQPEEGEPKELPAHLKRQLVDYPTKEPAGTLIIDTANTHLYVALGGGKAMRYGIGVGRDGFTWSGRERVSRMSEWPDWYPPADMIERQPYLPRMMAGGPGNPLGARALYLGKTLYRIHGTNQPSTIGKFVSSGCIRMLNEDVMDLYQRVNVGSQVVVLPGKPPASASAAPTAGAGAASSGAAPSPLAPAPSGPTAPSPVR
jgi:lipoprotein-anchoring transpeptidase ErfK/SrfK